MASVNTYDAIVLDWMLPGRDGVAVCQSLRASRLQTPILMLTRTGRDRGPRSSPERRNRRLPHKAFRLCRAAGPTPRPSPIVMGMMISSRCRARSKYSNCPPQLTR